MTPTPQAGQSSADPNEVARQIALVTMEGLQVGGVSTSESVAPTIRTLHAGGSYHVQCNKGGEVVIGQLPPAIGQSTGPVGIVGVTQDWQDCAWDAGGAQISANGRISLSGEYDAFSDDQNIGVTGSFNTSPGGTTEVDGRVTGNGAFVGTIGDVGVSIDGTGIIVPPADLSGGWHGMATFNEVSGCTGSATLSSTKLAHSGNQLSGPLSYTVKKSIGSLPFCSRSYPNGPIGGGGKVQVSGTAQNGTLNLSAGGLTLKGTYNASGTWMGGKYSGSIAGFQVSGFWQMIR